MKRAGKVVLLAHCILNVNAKVDGLATVPAGCTALVTRLLDEGYGIIQLPCMKRCTDYAAHYPSWSDWKWQYAHRITSAEGIASFLEMSDAERDDVDRCLSTFRMAVTPYYASLIDPEDPADPIRRVCVPDIQETYPCESDLADPLGEVRDSPVPHIVHRYPDRVLFLITLRCSTYCRYCTRRRVVGEEDRPITESALKTALAYIRSHSEIRDVLLSGGDPLVMGTEKLEHIIAELRKIPHDIPP